MKNRALDEFKKHLKDEMTDMGSYMDICRMAKEDGCKLEMQVACDIAGEEKSHAKLIMHMMERAGEDVSEYKQLLHDIEKQYAF